MGSLLSSYSTASAFGQNRGKFHFFTFSLENDVLTVHQVIMAVFAQLAKLLSSVSVLITPQNQTSQIPWALPGAEGLLYCTGSVPHILLTLPQVPIVYLLIIPFWAISCRLFVMCTVAVDNSYTPVSTVTLRL